MIWKYGFASTLEIKSKNYDKVNTALSAIAACSGFF